MGMKEENEEERQMLIQWRWLVGRLVGSGHEASLRQLSIEDVAGVTRAFCRDVDNRDKKTCPASTSVILSH
jgi:hypothetical protein